MRQKRNIINKNSKYITYTQFFLDYNFKVCSIFIFQIVSMSHYLNGTPPKYIYRNRYIKDCDAILSIHSKRNCIELKKQHQPFKNADLFVRFEPY